jgi:hypothetical protein
LGKGSTFTNVKVTKWTAATVLNAFLRCRPLAIIWDPSIQGTCGSFAKSYIGLGSVNVVTDAIVIALPIPHVLALELSWRRKIGLVIMLSLGLV